MTNTTSFMDEDWTGLTKSQIKSRILFELEEEECKAEGHLLTVAIYCRRCGEYFDLENLQLLQKKKNVPLADKEELEKQHDECKDGIHKWEQEQATVCTICGMYGDEYNDRRKSSV
jgi:ribosomal protein L37E